MSNLLKPYTIVPPNLYVKREADRQLHEIIAHMGRPGYILVSRQMGKTNLLLNAKRELSNQDDKFVYVDLSNIFADELSCFQNIIDLTLETCFENSLELFNKILNFRKSNSALPPHKQHESELKLLLRNINGKLVIILDEIDALTKTEYSDKIFAQIRSVYFSRANYVEFDRLTYILSGVVEPSEIIRDPKISPFNIGEKIFLNDFSKEEFYYFICKSKLDGLPPEVIDRIFYWTNGNPRMTWDLCARIEQKINISVSGDVDRIVQDLYFTSFDRPPVDHIRELVRADKSIRDAITEIDYNKGNLVPDSVKSKLYLAGIINYEENEIKIKNRIIRQALSRSWIESIKEQEEGLLKIALELLEHEKFQEAIQTFEKFLTTNEHVEAEAKALAYFHMGLAYYNSRDFENAISTFLKSDIDQETQIKSYQRLNSLIGTCYFALEKLPQSVIYFQKVIESGYKDDSYLGSLLNCGIAHSKLNSSNSEQEAIAKFQELIKVEDCKTDNLKLIDDCKIKASYHLAAIYFDRGELSESEYYCRIALETNIISLKAIVYYMLIRIVGSIEEKQQLVGELTHYVISNKLSPVVIPEFDRPYEFTKDLFTEIILLAFENEIESFNNLIAYICENSQVATIKEDLFYSLVKECFFKDRFSICNDLLKYIKLTNVFRVGSSYYYNSLKLLSFFNKYDADPTYSLEYISLFEVQRSEPIDLYDFDIVTHIIYSWIREGHYQDALEKIGLMYLLKKEVNRELHINYLVLYYLELKIEQLLGDVLKANTIAKKILTEIEENDYSILKGNNDLLGESGLEDIKRRAINQLSPISNRLPKKSDKLFNRNDIVKVRYNDGRIIERKFKKVELDIKNKMCQLI